MSKKQVCAAQGAARKMAPCVYCGPTVRGVAKQNTVFAGNIPEALQGYIDLHPEAKAMLVAVDRFAEARKKIETAGTAEAILYNKLKSEM